MPIPRGSDNQKMSPHMPVAPTRYWEIMIYGIAWEFGDLIILERNIKGIQAQCSFLQWKI